MLPVRTEEQRKCFSRSFQKMKHMENVTLENVTLENVIVENAHFPLAFVFSNISVNELP